jgi:hypothetical protein
VPPVVSQKSFVHVITFITSWRMSMLVQPYINIIIFTIKEEMQLISAQFYCSSYNWQLHVSVHSFTVAVIYWQLHVSVHSFTVAVINGSYMFQCTVLL